MTFWYIMSLASFNYAKNRQMYRYLHHTRSEVNKDLKIIEQQISDKTKYYELELTYPQVDYFDQEIEHKINRKIKDSINNFANKLRNEARLFYDFKNKYIVSDIPFQPFKGNTSFVVHLNTPSILSITIDYYEHKGGAHGLTKRKAYNYDLSTGKEIEMKDLFEKGYNYIGVINEFIEKSIAENPDEYFVGKDGFISIQPNQSFYLLPNNLVIYFDLYQIAPYVKGIPEFNIPFEIFGNELLMF